MRKHLWNHLVNLADIRESPWFITGDFNDLLSNEEKAGGPERPEGSFSDMRTFFAEGDLFDLQHSGDSLSWRGQRGEHFVRCRLDRAAANSSWAESYPTARCMYLAYEGSDHRPIISVFEPGKKRRPGLFRYDRRLKDNAEVTKLILEAWAKASNMPIAERIKVIRGVISRWNKEHQANSRLLIEQKRQELETAQSSSENNTQLIHQITEDLKKAYKAEEAYWRQRSRLLWLRLGDRNSGFFHAATKNRRRANALTVIEDSEGNPVFEEEQIAQVIVSYFGTLFTTLASEKSDIQGVVEKALRPVISNTDN